MASAQKDNSTFRLKAKLRKKALAFLDTPVVMETHGGYGAIYQECYGKLETGIVFEKDTKKAAALGKQRPTWAVYECDCVSAIRAGVGLHLPVNLYDVDPYGSPWDVIDAILSAKREWPARLVFAVNDGLRQKLKMAGGWDVGALSDVCVRYGNGALYTHYLEICQEMLTEKVRQAGYGLSYWGGYYCGWLEQMTHYAAVYDRITNAA